VDRAQVKKVLFCSGKVYYDLVAEREKRGAWDVAIIRLERLYPLPVRTLPKTLEGISQDAVVRYVQEEPANQGAWPFMSMHLSDVIGRPVQRVSRPSSSSPAVGSHHRHEVEQATLVEAAFE
jgi:2-oxoglutarate dehydrogenase E1 component